MKILALLVAVLSSAFGQTIAGRLVGTVTDATKAAVPDAAVTIVNQDTGVVWHLRTDAHGDYTAPALPAGPYRIQVEQQGFRNAVAADNIVNVAQDTRVDITLQVGSVAETVDVVAAAPLVRSTSSEIGETIDHKQVDELPLNGRLFSQLMQLVPGAVPDGPTDAAGALADESTLTRAATMGLDPAAYLERHDAYSFFEATGDLLKTGLTQTNVMDVRVVLIGP